MGKLTTIGINRLAKPGLHGDGDGLYLQISKTGAKSWIFSFTLNYRSRSMGLGPLDLVGLADARMKAFECRKLVLNKVDPIEARIRLSQQLQSQARREVTFDECAFQYISAHRASWKNEKHAAQWQSTLRQYVSPLIGVRPVSTIDVEAVMSVLSPIWYVKTETASRVRNRIELILAWARVNGHRSGDNPALWRGNLDQLLPKRSSLQKAKHFEALPMGELPGFVRRLRSLNSSSALALEFLILTAARTNEVIGARWSEIDLLNRVWRIPSERMKAGREHRVPLSDRCIEILKKIPYRGLDEFVFQGRQRGRPLSNGTFLSILKKQMGLKVTAHGFRSTFRDWAAERTQFQNEVIEMALAHAIRDSTEAAYRRGDLMTKRGHLMNDWMLYCGGQVGDLRALAQLSNPHTKLISSNYGSEVLSGLGNFEASSS